jgi:hypothetical protein
VISPEVGTSSVSVLVKKVMDGFKGMENPMLVISARLLGVAHGQDVHGDH